MRGVRSTLRRAARCGVSERSRWNSRTILLARRWLAGLPAMMTTQPTKHTGLIRGLRDRFRRSRGNRRDVDVTAMMKTDPMTWDPFRMMRDMLRWEPLAWMQRNGWMPHFEVRENDNTLRFID